MQTYSTWPFFPHILFCTLFYIQYTKLELGFSQLCGHLVLYNVSIHAGGKWGNEWAGRDAASVNQIELCNTKKPASQIVSELPIYTYMAKNT